MPLTIPQSVTQLMQDLAGGLGTILGVRLIGVYLGGSVASGDFAEATSDIDFLVVTDGALSQEDQLAIALLHKDLRNRHAVAVRLEGDYAPREQLVPGGTVDPVPGCERGKFLPRVGEIMLSADNISDMRTNGIPFAGPNPVEVLPAVSREDVRLAVRTMLLDGPGPCDTPADFADELLNLVRSLCALESGRPTSKGDGAEWGLSNLDRRWHPAIRSALAIRQGAGTEEDAERLVQDLPLMDRSLRTQYA